MHRALEKRNDAGEFFKNDVAIKERGVAYEKHQDRSRYGQHHLNIALGHRDEFAVAGFQTGSVDLVVYCCRTVSLPNSYSRGPCFLPGHFYSCPSTSSLLFIN